MAALEGPYEFNSRQYSRCCEVRRRCRRWRRSRVLPRQFPQHVTVCSVTLLERYHHLGGMASGGMVLVLDDMINGEEIVVSGIVDEFIAAHGKPGHGRNATAGGSIRK